MKKIVIDQAFWEIFPQAQISCLVVKGIDNSIDPAKKVVLRNCWKTVSARLSDS